VRRLEPEVGISQLQEAAPDEPGGGQHEDGQCHLRSHQSLPRTARSPTGALPRAGPEDLLKIGARGDERGRKAEEQCRDGRDTDRAGERCAVEVDGMQERDVGRREGEKAPHGDRGDQEPEHPAGESEERVLRNELPNDLPPRGAEGAADGDLAHARESAHEEQVRDIDAGDEEQKPGRGREDEDRRAGVAEDDVGERVNDAAHVARPR
jgi:hypothetical protein